MPVASTPELRNKESTNHQYTSKIFQFLQKRWGLSASDASFSMQAYKTKVLIWRMFMSSSMKAAIHLGPNYLTDSEICKNTKLEEIESLSNITQLVMEHSEEILNEKCMEYSSPSWARSVLPHDHAIKWAKTIVCVCADSVLCVGQMRDSPEAIERWRGHVEGLRLYSSYQETVGIDGEAIEFEWTFFPRIFSSLSILEEIQQVLGEAEDPARGVHRPGHLYVNVQ